MTTNAIVAPSMDAAVVPYPRDAPSGARAAPDTARPPHTNRGVYHGGGAPIGSVSVGSEYHRFDYYRATPWAEFSELIEVFMFELAQIYGEVRLQEGGAVRHYATHKVIVDRYDNPLVQLMTGGNLRPNVLAKGAPSGPVSDILRANWKHGPSRVDPCIDVAQAGLWAFLLDWTQDFARDYRIHLRTVLNAEPDHGDTIYLGSRSSQVFLRLYQPGLKRAQEEGRIGDQITQLERDTVRIELEFKPQNPKAKEAAAILAPHEFWSVSRWTSAFAKRILAMEVVPVTVSMRRESNRDRALRFMCHQYGSHLEGLLDEHGGDLEAFAEDILRRAGIAS